MPTLDVITSVLGVDRPELPEIIKHLEETGEPVAVEPNALKIIAPAVSIVHSRVNGLYVALRSENTDPQRMKRTIIYAFSWIADMYMILSGIDVPEGSFDKAALDAEKKFTVALLAVAYELLLEIGWRAEPRWEPHRLSSARIREYEAKLNELTKGNPLPWFARRENMKKGTAIAGTIIFFLIVIFFLFDSGILSAIWGFLFE